MYTRMLKTPLTLAKSFFLFGARGTGKTSWVNTQITGGLYIDLLESQQFNRLLANPGALEEQIVSRYKKKWIVIDEVQKIPDLLNEVHRLIEKYHYKFVLTGSSARSLRRRGVNLLAGRALTYHMHPLTVIELGDDFDLQHVLRYGCLPAINVEPDPEKFLADYVKTYLYQEVQQEGLTRNIGNFSRFLESASFSQGSVLNMAEIARDCAVNQKVVSDYFDIVEDLLIGYRLPVFTKHAKRRMVQKSKFYFFDVGVYRAIRPQGPYDTTAEIDGIAMETLFLEQLRAINDYRELHYTLYYWRTSNGIEVDFIAYGPNGIHAFEIKRGQKIDSRDLKNLHVFHKDHPQAKRYVIYGGSREEIRDGIRVLPIEQALRELPVILAKE